MSEGRGRTPGVGEPLPRRWSPRPTRRRGGAARVWVRVVRLVCALLSLTVLAGTGYAWASYQHFTSGVTQVDAIPGGSGADRDGAADNILLVGDDHRPANASPQELAQLSTGQDGGSTNTDTMMVLHLPAGGGAPTVISFPRDSWVDIPGNGRGKLNSAFADGAATGGDAAGMRLLIQTIQNMTGLTIDHVVRVSLLGFYDIANVLGPIQVCLDQPAHDSYSGIDLPAGVSTLNAQQALSFVRQRHGLPRGDLDREVRQQYFLSTELHKVLSARTLLNPAKTQALLSAVSSSIETDPGLDLLGLAGRFQSLSADKVTYTTIPITGTPTITDAHGDAVSVVSVDVAALPGFIDRILGTAGASSPDRSTPATSSPATTTAPGSVTVQVVNGTGRTGLGASTTTALQSLGFHTLQPATGPATRATTISYPAGRQASGEAVAAHVPGATLREAPSSRGDVVLTLGTDGAAVQTSPTAPSSPTPSASPAPRSAQAFTTGSCIN